MVMATPAMASLRGGLAAIACLVLSIHGADAADRGRQPPARFEPPAAAPLPQPAPSGRRTPGARVDAGVVPAGGVHHGPCARCSRHACPQCRLPVEPAGLHNACQHGLCPAHCPVRPEVFGFYGTQWRKWPGSAAVRTSFQEEATPARPPRAEVPKAAEESLRSPDATADGEATPTESAKPEAAAEDLPPVKRNAEEPPKAPLPKPFPEADDGAAAPVSTPKRARRRVLLDREIDGRVEPAPVIAVEHEESVEARGGTTPWRKFLASAPEPPEPDVPATGP